MKTFVKAPEPRHSVSYKHAAISPRSLGDDMVTGSTDSGKSGGHPDPPTGSTGGGHPTDSTHTSPVIAALVAVAIISAASVLVWRIVVRIRSSRRGRPPTVLTDKGDIKPTLSDVTLVSPHDSKSLYTAQWDMLTPVSVECASQVDQMRWHSLSHLASDDASLSTASTHSSKTKPKRFSMFSRASSPATTIAPDPEPIEFRVAMVIAMPSQHRSQTSGELCLGVSYSSLL